MGPGLLARLDTRLAVVDNGPLRRAFVGVALPIERK